MAFETQCNILNKHNWLKMKVTDLNLLKFKLVTLFLDIRKRALFSVFKNISEK